MVDVLCLTNRDGHRFLSESLHLCDMDGPQGKERRAWRRGGKDEGRRKSYDKGGSNCMALFKFGEKDFSLNSSMIELITKCLQGLESL